MRAASASRMSENETGGTCPLARHSWQCKNARASTQSLCPLPHITSLECLWDGLPRLRTC